MVLKGLLNPAGRFKAGLILIVQVMVIHSLQAQYLDPTHKTNVNRIDPLFETNLNDYKQLEQTSKGIMSSTVEGIENHKGLDALPDYDKAESEADRLSNIGHQDLQQKGREAKAKAPWLDEYLVDYSKPGNLKYRQTAEEIAAKTGNMMDNILGKLKDIGVDCRTVKGNKIKEPKYVIELEQQAVQDTIYDKFICEELRNQYSCNDSVSLTCVKRGMQWDPWQYKEVQIAGDTVYHGAKHLGHAIEWKKKRWGWHLNLDSAGWRVFLSNHLSIPLEQIHEQINFPGGARGIGSTHPVNEQWRIVFDAYLFGYNYREGKEICEQWAEDWTERCNLK